MSFVTIVAISVTSSGDVIIKTSSNPVYDQVVQAFIEMCNCRPEVYNLKEDGKKALDAAASSRGMKVAVGTRALKELMNVASGPFVYLLGMPLDEFIGSGEEIVGVSVLPDTQQVMKIVESMFPQVKRIGLLVSTDLQTYIVKKKGEFKKAGVQPVPLIGSRPAESLTFAQELDYDAVLAFPDSRVLSVPGYRLLLKIAHKKGAIVIAPSPQFLKLGGHIAFEVDIKGVAEKAIRLMNNPPPARFHVEEAPIAGVVINSKWVSRVNWKKPEGLKITTR